MNSGLTGSIARILVPRSQQVNAAGLARGGQFEEGASELEKRGLQCWQKRGLQCEEGASVLAEEGSQNSGRAALQRRVRGLDKQGFSPCGFPMNAKKWNEARKPAFTNVPRADASPVREPTSRHCPECPESATSRSGWNIPDAETPDACLVRHTASSASTRPRWIPQLPPAPAPDKILDAPTAEPHYRPATPPYSSDAWSGSQALSKAAGRSKILRLQFPIE